MTKRFKSSTPISKELEYLANDVATCWERVKQMRAEQFHLKERMTQLELALDSVAAASHKSKIVEKTP